MKDSSRNQKSVKLLFKEDKIQDIYFSYTKGDIVNIAKNHKMTSYSKYNKADLISYVADYILQEEVMSRCFLCMCDQEIEAFEKLIKNGKDAQINDPELFQYLLFNGYIGLRQNNKIVVPVEVMTAYNSINTKKFHQKRKRVVLVSDYYFATTFLYGVTPIENVISLFNEYENEKLTKKELGDIYQLVHVYRNDAVLIDDIFVDISLLDNRDYLNLLKKQQDKPYYIPQKNEIEWFGRYGGDMPNEKIMDIYAYLTGTLDLDELSSSIICFEIQENIRIGCDYSDILESINGLNHGFDSIEQVEEFTSLFNELWNNTRMIINRGHTPNEIINIAKNKKNLNKTQSNVIPFPSRRK